ncbi:PIN domain-containing protein [Streptomyces sp. NBC_00285]|uniref:PIN domain-containing protein n=1 Tax=Streptomyces sp. NBC_00285 TaxID=2975700 RepID=UPI002E29A73D|nr:PIN domain-containing protein [Streptomyces sp. NBC_00285]
MTDSQLEPPARPAPLDPFSSSTPHLVGIVDTNALMSSIENDCRHGRRSRLLRMSDNGSAVLFAADHVYDEMYERLPRFAKRCKVPLAPLVECFEEVYLPALRFVTVSDLDAPDQQVLAITDPDDVPTGVLAKLIAPCVVFSEDRHLKKPGLAPKDWRTAAASAVDIAEGVWGQTVTVNVAALPFRGAVELLTFTGRKVGVSPWLLGGILLGTSAFLLKGSERRKATAKFTGHAAEAIYNQLAVDTAREQRGIAGLRDVILPAPSQPTLRQQVAIALARQPQPVLATEVRGLIYDHFPDEPAVSVQVVRSVLEEGSEFVQVQRNRWQLGREVAPRQS